MEHVLVVTLTVRGTDIPAATLSVKGLLKSYFSRNPRLQRPTLDVEPKQGLITVTAVGRPDLEEYVRKATAELGTSRGWQIRYEINEVTLGGAAVEAGVISSGVPQVPSFPTAQPVEPRRAWAYKILLSEETLLGLGQVPSAGRHQIRDTLRGLASGDWEQWGKADAVQFASWREEGDGDELFSFAVPQVGTLLWQRAWSVDLLGRLAYPLGAYYEKPPPQNSYSPHIVIRALLPPDRAPEFRFQFDGRLYKEEPGLELDDTWRRGEPQDLVAYSEELYLLSPNIIDDVLSGEQRGLPLHLSEEQLRILTVPGPVLLSGEAGSGKTSVITQWLVINHLRHQELRPRPTEPLHQVFVTFSPRLREHTQFEFQTMLPKTARDHRTQFSTYRELLEGTLELAGEWHRYPAANEMTFERFMREYAPKLTRGSTDALLLWDEIRSVIKGGVTDESNVFIDFARYNDLSETRGQCKTPPQLREAYYEAAQAYQNYLFRNGLWDGIDLARACLRVSEVAPKYDRVACDEVQDLAPIEIVLLFKLLARNDVSDLFFTGDIAQVINPSGFQWSRLKQELGKASGAKTVPEVHYLSRNYRSCYEIVDLVNRVMAVRRDLLDDEVSHVQQVPLLPARVRPMVLKNSPLERMKALGGNPNVRLIVTKTAGEKTKVEELLGDARDRAAILTIEEAKGLEYEGVLLWNFFLPRHEAITRTDWELVFTPQRRQRLKESIATGGRSPYGLTYEFNLLHVGLTRARRLLFVYDEDPRMRIANLGEEVAQALASADMADFEVHWKTDVAMPEDLFGAGQRLLQRDTAQANRMFLLAAEAFEKKGQLDLAAESYEAAGAYDRSANCYRAAGDRPNELRVLARHHEALSEWAQAGRLLEERGRILSETGERTEAAESYEDGRRLFALAGDTKSAARCALLSAETTPPDRNVDRALKFDAAAEWLEKASDLPRAIQARERSISEAEAAKHTGKLVLPGEPVEDWIARQYVGISLDEGSQGRHAESALAARRAAGLLMNLAETPEHARRRAQYEGRCCESLAMAVESYIRAGETTQAASLQDQLLKRFRGGVEEAKELWNRFAMLYLGASELDQYAETVLQLVDYLSGRKEYREAIGQLDGPIQRCEQLGAFRVVNRLLQRRAEIARMTKDWLEVGDSLASLAGAHDRLGESLRAFETLHQAAVAYLEAEEEDRASQLFEDAVSRGSKIMSPTELGWYCYKEIAVEAYAKRGLYVQAFAWIERGSAHFAQDAETSLKRLEGHWSEQAKEVDRIASQMAAAESASRKQELEEKRRGELMMRGLAELSLAMVFYASAQLSENKTLLPRVREWLEKADASFKSSADIEIVRALESVAARLSKG